MKETEAFEAFDWPVEKDIGDDDIELLGTNLLWAIRTLMRNALTQEELSGKSALYYRVKVTALYD